MRATSLVTGFSIGLVLAVTLAACDNKPPTSPSPPPGGGGTPPPPPGPTVTRLEVDGPGTVAPGETAQFTATAHYSDNSTRNVTSEPGTIWRSSLTRVLAISAAGLATGGERGEASVTAMFSGRGSTKPGVIVVPAGTYRLAGTVTDTGIPVSGARIEVTHGPATGMVATGSSYRFYGVSGDTEIRVTKDGYHDERKRIQVTSHQTADIALTPTRPRENVEGTYTLTVTAADECSQLPEEARVRTYSAVLTQQGPQVTATLQGSTFLTVGSQSFNRFTGTLEADRLTFFLLDPFYYYGYFYSGDVIERLTTTTYVYFGGTAALSSSSGGRSGALDGVVGTMEGPPRYSALTSCRSGRHRLALVR